MHEFLAQFESRPVIFDGAMGSMIQRAGLTDDDFGGYPGVGEMLNLARSDVIESIHRTYLEAGADIIITNTFNASAIVLAEHDLADRAREINAAAVRIAPEVATRVSWEAMAANLFRAVTNGRPVYSAMPAAKSVGNSG